MPTIAGISGVCLYKITPAIDTRTMPAPDQIAYVIPNGIVLRVSVKK